MGDIEQTLIDALMTLLREQHRSEDELALVDKAYQFARTKHDGQVRKSGEPYITHPIEVATILAQIPVDTPTVCAALMHDVLEDCEVSDGELKQQFGDEITSLVEGVTKLGKLQFESKEERNAENFRKMFLSMAQDVRVVLLKLCDRLHNMRTLEHMKREKQLKKARETLEVFAPLANRMGMGKLRAELEDLSFKYLDTDAYDNLVGEVEDSRPEWDTSIQEMRNTITESLKALGVEAQVYGRVKNYFSIYKKMKRGDKKISDIYDLGALRVIVENEKSCYEALGVVHSRYTPVPGRFKDYIGMPKTNLYQSLHTTVISPSGKPIEVQIRTQDMHRIAEYGIAAHWRYKEKGASVAAQSTEEQKLSWLKQMLELKEDSADAQEYVESVKLDLFRDEVFVFTPRGDVFDLPQGATPVDFAYRVHTEVGHKTTGAMVNGKIVTLDYQLRNGDIVEVLTSKKPAPKLDWIKFVQTNHAKTCIRQWFKKNFREDHIEQGRMLLDAEVTRAVVDEAIKSGKMLEIAQQLNFTKIDDLFLGLGYGEVSLPKILNRLRKDIDKEKDEKAATVLEALMTQGQAPDTRPRRQAKHNEIEGLQGMLYHLAKCCSPLPGDAIVGVVTRSRGVMVHREDCINLGHVNPERLMTISWSGSDMNTAASTGKKSYHGVRLDVIVFDRVGIFKDVLTRIADTNTNVTNARVKMMVDNTAHIEVTVDIADLPHLERVSGGIKKLSDVVSVTRSQIRPSGKKKSGEDEED